MESICYDSMIPIYESIKGICLGLGVGALVTMVLYTTGILEKIKNKKSKQMKIVAGIGLAIMIICILVSLIVSIIWLINEPPVECLTVVSGSKNFKVCGNTWRQYVVIKSRNLQVSGFPGFLQFVKIADIMRIFYGKFR